MTFFYKPKLKQGATNEQTNKEHFFLSQKNKNLLLEPLVNFHGFLGTLTFCILFVFDHNSILN